MVSSARVFVTPAIVSAELAVANAESRRRGRRGDRHHHNDRQHCSYGSHNLAHGPSYLSVEAIPADRVPLTAVKG
jgi:hypothetical protein